MSNYNKLIYINKIKKNRNKLNFSKVREMMNINSINIFFKKEKIKKNNLIFFINNLLKMLKIKRK